jgi:predicted nucleic acid-binding protein
MIVVSNATPLISLSLINQLGLLKALYGQVYIPHAVYEEVVTKGKGRPGAQEVAQADWIVVSEVPEVALGTVQPQPTALHAGEIEAMELALWLQAELVILDERLARKIAEAQGLNIVGTVGILKHARDRGLLADLKGALEELRSSGIRISYKLYREVLGL